MSNYRASMRIISRLLSIILVITTCSAHTVYGAQSSGETDRFISETLTDTAIETVYPTKDFVIADFNVTDFGAVANDDIDDTGSFQAAINAANASGGGVVFAPAGQYRFDGRIEIRSGVTLRGDWADPSENGGQALGTILAVYGNKGNENASSFVRMVHGTGITNLSIWYPEQSLDHVLPYPWTIEQVSGNSATLENITLVNSYKGFKSTPSELHYLTKSYITALKTGIYVDMTTDIGRIEDVKMSPDYWSNSGLEGSPEKNELFKYMTENAEGIVMGRSDWEYMSQVFISGYKTGMRLTTNQGGESANAQFYQMHIEDCNIAFVLDSVNSYGLLVSDSSFSGGVGEDSKALYATEKFSTIAQFNTVDFGGDVVTDGAGVLSFENCSYQDWTSSHGLTVNNGSVILGQSDFANEDGHVYLNEKALSLSAVNSGYNRNLAVTDESFGSEIDINYGDQYVIERLPEAPLTELAVQPKPASDRVFNILKAPYSADNTAGTDVTDIIKTALSDAENAGGGTVYLPAGRYLINHPIVVPTGVELRGSWDVQHHTMSGGTAIFTNYGLNEEALTPLISIEESSGIKGITIFQRNQTTNNYKPCPFLIQGLGHDVYLINVTLPNAYNGVDLGTYDTSGHYVEYLAGAPLKTGIYVGGGSEGGLIRNVQFNPHYWNRLSDNQSNQGYTSPTFDALWTYQKDNLDAFQLGDVKDEVVFNTFVFGSLYGIHFMSENDGPNALVIGHGTDGSKRGVLVDDVGEDGVVMINTELVSLSTTDKVYITTGPDFESTVTIFNSSMWGQVDRAVDVNSGNIRIQQANFAVVGETGINAIGGKAYIYDSYFQQGNRNHVSVGGDSNGVEISNNLFKGGLQYNSAPGKVTGTNVKTIRLEMERNGASGVLKLTNITSEQPISGSIELIQPTAYQALFRPIHFDAVGFEESIKIDLPFLGSDLLRFKIVLDNGQSYFASASLGVTFADRKGTAAGSTPPAISNSANRYTAINGSWDGPEDLSLKADVKWDDENLYLNIVVTDNVQFNGKNNGDIWNGDSLQIGIDMSKAGGSPQSQTNELGFALTNNGTVAKWRWSAPNGLQSGELKAATAAIVRDEAAGITTYDIKIPFSALHSPGFIPNMEKIGFAILANDDDNDGSGGRKGCLEYNPGINIKETALFGDLYLLEQGSYIRMLTESAEAAVVKAENEKTNVKFDSAANFVCLLAAGDKKAELEARLANAMNPHIEVESIKINSAPMIIMYRGNTLKLNAVISPSNATTQSVTWSSSNNSVVSVNGDGTITALKTGTTTIMAKSSNGKMSIIMLEVKP